MAAHPRASETSRLIESIWRDCSSVGSHSYLGRGRFGGGWPALSRSGQPSFRFPKLPGCAPAAFAAPARDVFSDIPVPLHRPSAQALVSPTVRGLCSLCISYVQVVNFPRGNQTHSNIQYVLRSKYNLKLVPTFKTFQHSNDSRLTIFHVFLARIEHDPIVTSASARQPRRGRGGVRSPRGLGPAPRRATPDRVPNQHGPPSSTRIVYPPSPSPRLSVAMSQLLFWLSFFGGAPGSKGQLVVEL